MEFTSSDHTSADNLDLVSPEALEESLRTYLAVMDVLEGNRRYENLNPKCEPQLGRRGLYRNIGGDDAGWREVAYARVSGEASLTRLSATHDARSYHRVEPAEAGTATPLPT